MAVAHGRGDGAMVGAVLELAADDAECAQRDAELEGVAAVELRQQLAAQVAAHELDQLGGGGRVVRRGAGVDRWDLEHGSARIEELEQVPLDLGRPAPDHGVLERAGVAGVLEDGDDAPAQRAEQLPPGQRLGVDRHAGMALVGGGELRAGAEPGRGPVGPVEAPRAHAQPAEVLELVTRVRELPVEHRGQPLAVDEQVAHAEIAVDEAARARGRPVALQRGEGDVEDRMRAAQRVVHRPQFGEHVGGPVVGRGHPVDRGERRGDLVEQARVVGLEDRARVRGPGQRLEDRPLDAEHVVVAPVGRDFGDGHARRSRGAQQRRLGRARRVVGDVLELGDELATAGGKAPSLTRGAAREAPRLGSQRRTGDLREPLGKRAASGSHA